MSLGTLGRGAVAGAAAALVLAGVTAVTDADSRLADYAALAAGLLGVHLALRAAPVAGSVKALLGQVLVAALAAAGLLAAGAFALYAWWRPGLLEARYASYRGLLAHSHLDAARIADELGRLAAARASYLDPGFQAVGLGGTLGCLALLLGGFAAFRLHLARRWRRS